MTLDDSYYDEILSQKNHNNKKLLAKKGNILQFFYVFFVNVKQIWREKLYLLKYNWV